MFRGSIFILNIDQNVCTIDANNKHLVDKQAANHTLRYCKNNFQLSKIANF